MNAFKIPITDSAQIRALLPHRKPMILVDTLLNFSDKKATVGFTILKDNIFVDVHGFSETGLIEHMAQSAALYIGFKNHSENTAAKEGFIAGIKQVNIRKLPKVNDILRSEVSIIHEVMHLSTVKVSTFIGDFEIANAQMTTVLKEDQ